jgi:4'-phosphopantetheinyl transferase
VTIRLLQRRWPATDLPSAIGTCDVVVCTASLLVRDADSQSSLATLNAAERVRYLAYTNEIVARRFLAGRTLLREMLGAVLRVAPRDVPLREGLHGKPYLAAGTPESVWFSVSHTDDLLVVALSRSADVGVDVERARAFDQWHRVADRVLDGRERRQLDVAVDRGEDPGEAFLRHWCRVEAELKAVGCGIHGLDAHRAGLRPRGLRLADLTALELPDDIAAGARYQAAVALCAPGATYAPVPASLRQTAAESAQAPTPVTNPARASTP